MDREIHPFLQPLSHDVWFSTYKWETDTNVHDTFRRVAKFVASVEPSEVRNVWEERYFALLDSFKFVPGGRITSNAGTGLNGTCLINCFVSGFQGEDRDSIEGIYHEVARQAKILKSEGGYGCNFDVLRPRGAFVNGIGVRSPGVVKLMDLWDTSSEVITAGEGGKTKGKNKIRKGAMMGVMSCWHPSIVDFITVKQNVSKLKRFNLSVLITDEFIQAVKHHKPWSLEFPRTTYEHYRAWDGNLAHWKKCGHPTEVWHTYEDANELWDLIIQSTYTKNEPGVLFESRINTLNNLAYCEYITATNPCGEQPLPVGGACVLSSINLTQYVKEGKFDIAGLVDDIPTMVRFLDAINDLTKFPLPEQQKEAKAKRRIGIGYTGYGSALYLMKIPYGSKQALRETERLCRAVTNMIYRASAMLAKEKGSFPLFDKDKYLASGFTKLLSADTREMIEQHGIRNSHLTTCAPVGNGSVFFNNVSSGIEPVVSPIYTRTIIESNPPEDLPVPSLIDWDHKRCEDCSSWQWVLEGEEYLLRTVFKKDGKDTVYKIDRSRGMCREEEVYDYAVLALGKKFWDDMEFAKENPSLDYAKTIFNLSVDDHINTLALIAKFTDSAVSKTINVPNDMPFEMFKDIYMKAYDSGTIKGVTTYREGTMTTVLSVNGNGSDKIKPADAPERPASLPCQVHKIIVKGEPWLVFVGLYKGQPYEVFAGKVGLVDLPSKMTEGVIVKQKTGVYSFENEGEVIIKDISKVFSNDENETKTRLISTALQHGTPITKIVEQLNKAKGIVTDFGKSVNRALKKYVPEGEETGGLCPACGAELVFAEGCVSCKNRCGWTKCG